MAASFRLLVPQTPILISILCFTIIILLNQIFISYKKFAKILKYIAISLFAYVITSINVGGNIQNMALLT
jgi:hypothetical protein